MREQPFSDDGTAGMFWSLFFAGVAALPSNATTTIQNFWETCILIFT
jgi:hypothetical protein